MNDSEEIASRKLIDRLIPEQNWGLMLGLLTTTFELRPDFFEMDFLPSAFGLGVWEDRHWATRIALEKRLLSLEAAVVITEARRYRGRPRSLRLDVRPAVSPRGSVLHAKVTLLVFENAVRMIVGSANLTKQGYRENREAIAVLTVTERNQETAPLILQGLTGMEDALASWLTDDARNLIRRAEGRLKSWKGGHTDLNTAFVWSNGQTKLWRQFVARWPTDEAIQRITIISPFWAKDANLSLAALVGHFREVGPIRDNAELRLLTDAFEKPNGDLLPILPLEYATYDWKGLGVRATAQPVSPRVHPDELGGMEGFTGSRALHAKVVLVEGAKTGLAYVGSANFTARGWGFLPGSDAANTEAGLILKRSRHSADLKALVPELVGQPIPLGESSLHGLQSPEVSPPDLPWPEFIRQVLLAPLQNCDDRLELRIETTPEAAGSGWHARFLDKEGVPGDFLVPIEATRNTGLTTFASPLEPAALNRLLTDQEVLIVWDECQEGRPFPVNVDAAARLRLPIAPGKQSIEENHLISYYQGRIAWEELFPDPDAEKSSTNVESPSTVDSHVDKSRIQSYQIREFVEALAGLNQDLRTATQSEAAMRLALLGPVSPVALSKTILHAANSGRRTPTAAGFQLVEILASLQNAHSNEVPERLRGSWKNHVSRAIERVEQDLNHLLVHCAKDFGENKAFKRYCRTVLGSDRGFKL